MINNWTFKAKKNPEHVLNLNQTIPIKNEQGVFQNYTLTGTYDYMTALQKGDKDPKGNLKYNGDHVSEIAINILVQDWIDKHPNHSRTTRTHN